MSGTEGQTRYRALVKFWNQNYIDINGKNSRTVKANLSALFQQLRVLVEAERDKIAEENDGSSEATEPAKKKNKRSLPQATADDEYANICMASFAGLLTEV